MRTNSKNFTFVPISHFIKILSFNELQLLSQPLYVKDSHAQYLIVTKTPKKNTV